MAKSLIWLVNQAGPKRKFIDTATAPRWVIKGFQLSTLKYWELVEPMPKTTPATKTSGWWRPTSLGRKFALEKVKVPEYIWHYNDQRLSYDGDKIKITQALKNPFHYQNMLQGSFQE